MDGHIYRCELDGTGVSRVTDEHDVWHFLHGVSPDGGTLGFVRTHGRRRPGSACTHRLRRRTGHHSGHRRRQHRRPRMVARRGVDLLQHRALGVEARARPAGQGAQQCTHRRQGRTAELDGHRRLVPTPLTGRTSSRLPPIPRRHESAIPKNKEVEVVLVDTADWTTPLARVPLFGGQGTINVNSWSPDSTRFAFISFPIDTPTN